MTGAVLEYIMLIVAEPQKRFPVLRLAVLTLSVAVHVHEQSPW